MQLPVMIEPVGNNGFRAWSGQPLSLSAEGATREQALANLRQIVEDKLRNGAEMVNLEIGPWRSPPSRTTGIFANEAEYQEFRAILEENRRKAEEEEGYVP